MKMLNKISLSMVFLFILILTTLSCKDKVNFSGEWTLDRQKTDLTDNNLFLAKFTVTQKENILQTSRTYENEFGEQYPFDEPLTLDGKEYKITVYDMPRTSAARWSEDKKSLIIDSHIIFSTDYGDLEIESTETWTLIEKGTVLSLHYTSKSVEGDFEGTFFYNKVLSDQ
jgi:hypothetical protein